MPSRPAYLALYLDAARTCSALPWAVLPGIGEVKATTASPRPRRALRRGLCRGRRAVCSSSPPRFAQ